MMSSLAAVSMGMPGLMRLCLACTPLFISFLFGCLGPVSASTSSRHQPRDGVLKLYGACGPQNALRNVADAWQARHHVRVTIICGPEQEWSSQAQQDADIIWGTSEQSMSAFLVSFPGFSSKDVLPVYLRPTVIAVKRGNPHRIYGFEDLLRPGIRIIVTEGSGISNTSGTGSWEDVAGRLGRLDDVVRFRSNIVAFSTGSGASFKAFQTHDADAWITWPEWAVDYPQILEIVPISPDRRIWRDLNVVVSRAADPEAALFVTFLVSGEAQKLMARAGYVR